MTPFSDGTGPEVPIAPTDLPIPNVPLANFSDIGQQLAQGAQKAKPPAVTKPGWFDWIAELVGVLVGGFLSILGQIFAFLLSLWFRLFQEGEGGTDQIAGAAIQGMFGVSNPSAAFTSVAGAGARDAVTGSISQVVINGLFPGATTGAAGAIAPGHTGADNFIRITMRIAIEGWLQGWLSELFSVGLVRHFGDLKDTTERTLGLGRLMRRALAAPLKIMLEDPFTWELNQRFHPTLLQPGELVRQYLRGILDRSALQAQMDYHGYTSDKVDALINIGKLHLSPAELLSLELHSSRTQGDTIAALQAQGYDSDTAPLVRFVQLQSRLDAWNLRIIDELATAVAQRRADIGALTEFMQESQIPQLEQGLIRILVDNRVAQARTFFSMAEGAQLVENGIWSLDQYRTLATQHGYTSDDETSLELLTLLKVKNAADAASRKAAIEKSKADAAAAKAAKAQAAAANAANVAQAKGVSLAAFQTLIADGLKTVEDYRAFLLGKGIAPDNADALVQVERGKLNKAQAATGTAAGATATAKAKGLSVSQLEAAVKQGVIGLDEYHARLVAVGVSDADATTLQSVLSDQLGAAKTRADALAAAKTQAAVKHVNLSEEEKAVRLGLATVDDYTAFLTAHEFGPDDITLLVGELNAQLATDKAAKTTKALTSPAGSIKGLSLAQLEKAVRAGLTPISDYQAALATQGYDADSQAALVGLLRLQMQQDQDTLAANGRAAALLGQREVSLADLSRAVKLGVVPISVYMDALNRAGVTADDAQILTLTLAAQIKTTKAVVASQVPVSKTLTAAGFNLATMEKDVFAGRLTLDQFTATLTAAGVSSDDVQAISSLVTDELANAQAAARLVLDATAKAAAKGLSLAQETAAVKAGVKSTDDFAKVAASLGYDPADVATLEATLLEQLGAAAAKKTAAAGAPKQPAPQAVAVSPPPAPVPPRPAV